MKYLARWGRVIKGALIVAGLAQWNAGSATEAVTDYPAQMLPNGMQRQITATFDHRDQLRRNIGSP
jgi:hypothetical protein